MRYPNPPHQRPVDGEGVKLGQDHGTGPGIPAEGQEGQQEAQDTGRGGRVGQAKTAQEGPQDAPQGHGERREDTLPSPAQIVPL